MLNGVWKEKSDNILYDPRNIIMSFLGVAMEFAKTANQFDNSGDSSV